MIVEALGNKPEAARAAWEQALTRAPNHAAALKGLEGQLTARAYQGGDTSHTTARQSEAFDALATHLGRMADAYASEPALAAWLHVDFEPHLEGFYRACGFRPTAAGLIDLTK